MGDAECGDEEDDDLDEAPTQDPQHPGPADGVPEAAPLGTARAAGVQAAMPEGAPASGPGSSSAADGAPGDGTAGSSATPPDEAGDAVRDQPVVAGLGDLSRYDVDALMRLGHYSTRKGRHDRAVSVYSEALIRKPGRVEVHYERAMALLRLGDARRARAAFQRCNELSAAYAPCRYGAARALEALGQTSEAISAYRAYLTQYPTSSQVGAVERRLERLGAP